jgi:hypothetical protein
MPPPDERIHAPGRLLLSGSTGENWIETGIYLGKVDLRVPTLFGHSE